MTDGDNKTPQQPDTEPPESIAFHQFMDLFILPEIRRRQDAGIAPKPLELTKVQVLFSADGSRPMVRLNGEVKAQVRAKFKEGVTKSKDEIEAIQSIDLPEDERDHGHFTAIRWRGSWRIALSAIYNRRTADHLIELGQQFLAAAEGALERGHLRVFADTVFSAAELAAKASCICWVPDAKFKAKTTHTGVITRYGQYAHAGNALREHSALLARLHKQRGNARYLQGRFSLTPAQARIALEEVRAMLKAATKAAQ